MEKCLENLSHTSWQAGQKKLVGPDIDFESKNFSSLLSLTKYLQSFQAQNNVLGKIAVISATRKCG